MIKLTPPAIEQMLRHGDQAYLVGMQHANSQPECLRSVADLKQAREMAKRLNATVVNADYPRFIGVSVATCYFDPAYPAPVRLKPRFPLASWLGPFPIAAATSK